MDSEYTLANIESGLPQMYGHWSRVSAFADLTRLLAIALDTSCASRYNDIVLLCRC